MPQPMQPLYRDKRGVPRFQSNSIVRYLLDEASAKGIDLNHLDRQNFPDEDWQQFLQLIGQSLTCWGDSSHVSDEAFEAADKVAKDLPPA